MSIEPFLNIQDATAGKFYVIASSKGSQACIFVKAGSEQRIIFLEPGRAISRSIYNSGINGVYQANIDLYPDAMSLNTAYNIPSGAVILTEKGPFLYYENFDYFASMNLSTGELEPFDRSLAWFAKWSLVAETPLGPKVIFEFEHTFS